ncbi:MAG: acetate/propionate family kinase [Coriobacteriales bacterium]|jgi:acetate kinase
MKTLVVNAGSSSLRYQLLDVETREVEQSGRCEKIGGDGSFISLIAGEQYKKLVLPIPNHEKAVELVLKELQDHEVGVISSLKEIDAVGHRIVHGGKYFDGPALVDGEVLNKIRECAEIAPLHNMDAIKGIEACMHQMPGIPQVVSFDTAFHMTIPAVNHMYALPYKYYEKYGLRKYGFHGMSHKYVSRRAAEMMGANVEDLKIITCHMGNGGSVTAVRYGESYDTSMGLTPLDGIIMGTRCGSIDPSVVTFLMEHENLTPAEMTSILNKESGLLGISGVSNDLRDIDVAIGWGNERAKLAFEMYAQSIRRYIGQYLIEMVGADAVVMTAGIGENSPAVRAKVFDGLEPLGFKIDRDRNEFGKPDCLISSDDSLVPIFAIHTNEEYLIALDAKEICEKYGLA